MILIVDDDADVREAFSEALSIKYPDRIECASEGKDALEKLSSKKFHYLITDINMPNGMGGVELLTKVKELYPEIKTIAISGYIDNENKIQVTNLANVFLTKPVSLKEIGKHVV